CYLLHWPGNHPLEDTIAAFETLVERGLIRSWGVSNFDEEGLARAIAIAGSGRVACNQVLYHLKERAIEHAVVPSCAANDVAVVAYSPFGSGDFPTSGSRGGRVLNEIAGELGVTPHAVALAFLVRAPGSFAIPKASRTEHVEANAVAATLTLTPEQQQRLDAAFPRGPRRRGVPTL